MHIQLNDVSYSDNNSQQECNQWKTRSEMQDTKFSSSFDQYQSSDYQEDQINVDNKVATLVQMDVKQEKQCANYNSPNEEFSDNWAMPYVITDSNSKKSYSPENPNISKIPNHPMNHANRTSEVKTINEIMQNSMISETRTSLTKEETKFSNNFDQPKNTNQQEGQVNLDNKIDTLVQMNIKQEEQSVNVHLSKQEHPDNWAMSHVITDSNLDRAIDILQKANISIIQNHSMNQTTSANTKKLNEAKQLISETKTTSILDKCTNPKSVKEDSNSDLQPNAITVESNQNIQHALEVENYSNKKYY
ncbi:PREDICTED: asparagine-rich protein-like [Ceratosolen solmsi marchali]|uniref:Asparagine-rich protein-like n=1 Tax=Ceratosolen solmsi marchali TaxID=326594 RepID=A0AAJ6YQD2_9HYME|nr:PREDICTED: asparagine-rich protein-like [Ceratosolen solmsi marchali]